MKGKRPFKKSIGIVGEGLTERMYFDYIRKNRRYTFTLKPDLMNSTEHIDISRNIATVVKYIQTLFGYANRPTIGNDLGSFSMLRHFLLLLSLCSSSITAAMSFWQ